MSRTLVGWELRKLWSMPTLGIFLLLCLGFNLLVVAGGRPGPLPTPAAPEPTAADIFENYDTAALSASVSRYYLVTSPVADALNAKYACLNTAVARLAAADAALSPLAGGQTDALTGTLDRLGRALLAEGMVFAALLALAAAGYEQLARTEGSVLATRVGRGIRRAKLAAGALSAVGAFGLLALGSTGAFAAVWRLGPTWGQSISGQSHLLYEGGPARPFITWAPMTVAGYLAAGLALSAAVVLVVFLLAFALALAAGDTLKSFWVLLLCTAATVFLIGFARDERLWVLFETLQCTPAALLLNRALWFTEGGVTTLLPWQEAGVTALWLGVGAALLRLAGRRFDRKDVC